MKEISQFDISDRTKIILKTGEYKNEPRIDLRLYVRDGDKYIPTKKGINLHSEWQEKLIEMVNKLENE